jgi:hypothetical protein
MSNYSFINMNSPMHHPHQQRYHKSSNTQDRRVPLLVYLVHHTNIEVRERSGMINHQNPTTIIVEDHWANVTLDRK